MKRRDLILIGILIFAGTGHAMGEKKMSQSIYDFNLKTIDGAQKNLGDFKGKALLIVNTASRCGFTPQYKSLEALYGRYKKRRFEVLGFPANNFMAQEPGTEEEIKKFCELKFGVTFPMFAKISVKGSDIHPLYAYLTSLPGFEGDITWNFNKFLVSPEGRVTARFDSKKDPLAPEVTSQIEEILPA